MESNIIIGEKVTGQTVVSLALAKANANIEYTHQDDLLNLYLSASIQDAENYISSYITRRNVTIEFKDWAEFMVISANPITVTEITYKDANGDVQTVPVSDYKLISDLHKTSEDIQLLMVEYPTLEDGNRFPITLTGFVGYLESEVPDAIKSAILLKFANKELFREDAPKTGADRSFNAALRPYRKW